MYRSLLFARVPDSSPHSSYSRDRKPRLRHLIFLGALELQLWLLSFRVHL